MKLIRVATIGFLLGASYGMAGEEAPCYPAESPVDARTQIVWCKAKGGKKEFFRITFKPSPDQCKVSVCERQTAPKGARPVDEGFEKVPLSDCAAALNRPGCFMK